MGRDTLKGALACTDRASSVFLLGNGDPIRSAFASAFLDSFEHWS
jgi:hypothetical protein